VPTHYLYRHIRADLNVPIWIGIGQVSEQPRFNTTHQTYRRAYALSLKTRNKFWQEAKSASKIEVEILLESDSQSFIEQKEKEFISLYGTIIDGTGTLANIELGGYKTKKLHKTSIEAHEHPVYVYFNTGEFYKKFKSVRFAAASLGVAECNVSFCALKNKGVFSGYQFFYENMGDFVSPKKYVRHGGRAILGRNMLTGEVIEEIKTFGEFKKRFKMHQRDAYPLLENGGILNGVNYIFKDVLEA